MWQRWAIVGWDSPSSFPHEQLFAQRQRRHGTQWTCPSHYIISVGKLLPSSSNHFQIMFHVGSDPKHLPAEETTSRQHSWRKRMFVCWSDFHARGTMEMQTIHRYFDQLRYIVLHEQCFIIEPSTVQSVIYLRT